MRALRFFVAFPSLAIAALSVAIDAVFSFIFAFIDARAPRELFDEPRLALSVAGGDQIDGATYFHNRHEAGLPRLGSLRHI